MLQRTYNCNDAEITEVNSICAFCYFAKRRTALQSVQKVEHQAPHRDNRFTTKQRDSKRARETSTHRGRTTKRREQERTMRQTHTSNNTAREQDKTREQQIVKQIKLKKKRCRK